jgi:ribonuclease HI
VVKDQIPGLNCMGAWASLYMAHRLGIDDIHLLGDSKIVIGWLNKKTNLQVVALESWKERIVELFKHFRKLSFAHIFREDNKVADVLSKKALFEIP